MSVNGSSAATAASVTSGTRSAAAACSLKIGRPASTSACSETSMSSNCTDWWQMSKTTPRCRRSAPIASLAGIPASPASAVTPPADHTCSRK